MESFIMGWVVSGFWAVFLIPVFLVKKAFALPYE